MKTALITGSARRLGKEIAQSLIADGWKVIIHYNTTHPSLELQHLAKVVVQADLTKFEELPKLFSHGKIDLLINSASIYEKISFLESTEQDFDNNYNIHVKAPYFLSQMFAKQGGSHIINIVDSYVSKDKTVHFPYLASKKALLGLSQMLSVELAPQVRVNAILPGLVDDVSDNMGDEFKEKRRQQLPQKEFVKSTDIIQAIKSLINSNLTGQNIYVDAGEQFIK